MLGLVVGAGCGGGGWRRVAACVVGMALLAAWSEWLLCVVGVAA